MSPLVALKKALVSYQAGTEEHDFQTRMLTLLEKGPIAFTRQHLEAHFTASAWVIHPKDQCVLLLHHQKLDRWLQPGGHADGNLHLGQVAAKELEEETGLHFPAPDLQKIFDLDIHPIPALKGVPAHAHYDVRYLFLCPTKQTPSQNSESKAIRWVPLAQVPSLVKGEESILRMIKKSA